MSAPDKYNLPSQTIGELNPGSGTAVFQRIPSPVSPFHSVGNPEVRVLTHRRRAAEIGLSNRDLGFAVSALVDGAKASDFQFQGKEIDLRLMAEESFAHRTHLLEQMPIAAPDGSLITLGAVASHRDVREIPVPTPTASARDGSRASNTGRWPSAAM